MPKLLVITLALVFTFSYVVRTPKILFETTLENSHIGFIILIEIYLQLFEEGVGSIRRKYE